MIRFSVAFFIFLKDYHEMSSLFKPPFFVKNNRYTNTLYPDIMIMVILKKT